MSRSNAGSPRPGGAARARPGSDATPDVGEAPAGGKATSIGRTTIGRTSNKSATTASGRQMQRRTSTNLRSKDPTTRVAPALLASTTENQLAEIPLVDSPAADSPAVESPPEDEMEMSATSLLDGLAGLPLVAPVEITSATVKATGRPGSLVGAPVAAPQIQRQPAIRVPTPRQRRAAKRLQARKVGRIVRHIDPWSVLKVSLLLLFCTFLVVLTAGVLLWNLVSSLGYVADVENFLIEAFALESFAFDGRLILRVAVLGGLILVLALAAVSVVVVVAFNLVSDLVGGIRFTVIEEERARPRPSRTRNAEPSSEGGPSA